MKGSWLIRGAAMAHLAPGEPVQGQVGVAAAESGPGEVRGELVSNGNPGLSLHSTIRSCHQRWAEGECAGGADEIQVQRPVAIDGTTWHLTTMSGAGERWLLFEIWLPSDSAADATDGSVRLQVHASGSGDDVTASPRPCDTLAPTGTKQFLHLLASAGAIVLGLALTGAAILQWKGGR